MERRGSSPSTAAEVAPEETSPAAKSFKTIHLRPLMKEREDLFRRMIEVDYDIWVLEFLRVWTV